MAFTLCFGNSVEVLNLDFYNPHDLTLEVSTESFGHYFLGTTEGTQIFYNHENV